jgi:hypothetical protein
MYSPHKGSRNTEKQAFLAKLDKVPRSTSHARDPISLPPRWAPVQIVHTVAYTLCRLHYPLWDRAWDMKM